MRKSIKKITIFLTVSYILMIFFVGGCYFFENLKKKGFIKKEYKEKNHKTIKEECDGRLNYNKDNKELSEKIYKKINYISSKLKLVILIWNLIIIISIIGVITSFYFLIIFLIIK